MLKNKTIEEVKERLLDINCLCPNITGNIFTVKDTGSKYKIILESSPIFFIYPSDPDAIYIWPSKISFLVKKYMADDSSNYFRITPERFFDEIPEEAKSELLFHLDIF